MDRSSELCCLTTSHTEQMAFITRDLVDHCGQGIVWSVDICRELMFGTDLETILLLVTYSSVLQEGL